MPKSRYNSTPVLGIGRSYGTSQSIIRIRNAIKTGVLDYDTRILKGMERLDTLAGEIYGEGRYWWILAAASDIGWGMQVPPGTIIRIPDLDRVLRMIG